MSKFLPMDLASFSSIVISPAKKCLFFSLIIYSWSFSSWIEFYISWVLYMTSSVELLMIFMYGLLIVKSPFKVNFLMLRT